MGSSKGYERPLSARKGMYKFENMCWAYEVGMSRLDAAVSYSGAASNQKYVDAHSGQSIVCSGTPKLIGTKLGFQFSDQADGLEASFVITGQGLAPIKSTDTPAIGAALYWDDTNKYLTTTSSGNTLAAISVQDYADWIVGDNADHTSLPFISGRKWGRIKLND